MQFNAVRVNESEYYRRSVGFLKDGQTIKVTTVKVRFLAASTVGTSDEKHLNGIEISEQVHCYIEVPCTSLLVILYMILYI